jgi:hypothetical protein
MSPKLKKQIITELMHPLLIRLSLFCVVIYFVLGVSLVSEHIGHLLHPKTVAHVR